MNTILNGCDSPADIVSKKAQFFQNLKTCGIQEDDYKDYFNESNYQWQDSKWMAELSDDGEAIF